MMTMAKQKTYVEMPQDKILAASLETIPLWQLDIAEVAGHNLEARGRDEVNRLLASGWRLLHIYTLKYQEAGVWRERPMAILGRLRNNQNHFQLESAPPSSL
jgi:FtsZ-binding cell division protein ZapB